MTELAYLPQVNRLALSEDHFFVCAKIFLKNFDQG